MQQQQKEFESEKQELEQAVKSLTALQKQLENELNSTADQQDNDLLTKCGITGSQKTDQAKSAVERFQKLCRDARRRAMGS